MDLVSKDDESESEGKTNSGPRVSGLLLDVSRQKFCAREKSEKTYENNRCPRKYCISEK